VLRVQRTQGGLLAMALLAAALLAACGGGDNPTATAGPSAAGSGGPPPTAGRQEVPQTSSTVTGVRSTRAAVPGGAGTPPAGVPAEIAALEREVVERINAIRRERGLSALQANATLAQVARDYSCLMARRDFFSHTGPDGSTVADRVREVGVEYRLVGENLARNTNARQPVELAVQGWMDSEGHRENILRAAFTETGVGICREGDRYYFTQIFLQPR
jgi:uncharacterized protein YkwD